MSPADTSFATVVLWIAGLATMLSFGTAIWTIFSGPAKRNATRLDGQGNRLDAHELRLGAIEQTLRAIPAKEELHELELAMTRLQGEMKTMSEAMRGQAEIMKRVEALVGRHEDHLLKK
jgi:hypothetical protein